LFLLVAHGAEVSAQISQSRARVNDSDPVRIRDFQAGSVSAELLKTGIADRDGSPRTVKLEPHRVVFHEGNPPPREHQAGRFARSLIAGAFAMNLPSAKEIIGDNLKKAGWSLD